MANYHIFLFLLGSLVNEFEETTALDRKSKRSDGLVHDVVQQMVAEQIERKKILKGFREMKNEIDDVKRELKERNSLMHDTKFLQKKLLQEVKIMKEEVKNASMTEVKTALNSFSERVTAITGRLELDMKKKEKSIKSQMKRHEKIIKSEISETNKKVSKLDRKDSKQNELLWKEMTYLQNRTSSNEQNVGFTVLLHQNIKTSSSIVFKDIIENVGGDYNSTNGIFNCTKAGLYLFSATLMARQNINVYGIIMKNENIVAHIHGYSGSSRSYPTVSSTVVLRLGIGDRVYVKGTGIVYHVHYSSFAGVLIKP